MKIFEGYLKFLGVDKEVSFEKIEMKEECGQLC
jgi:hypothetical protein